ncbi:hypothetical protein FF1_033196 [Malus domestica]
MSLVEKEISSVVGGSGGGCVVGDDGDDDDEECGGSGSGSGSGGSHGRCRCSEEKAKKQRGFSAGGLSRNFGRAKQVVLHPFGRSKRQLPRKARGSASGASSLASSCAFSSGKMFGGGGGNGGGNKSCYFCFTQPPTLDSPMGSQTSDPEHPNFTFGMLRAFVESNEFYSKDCNPHLDIVAPWMRYCGYANENLRTRMLSTYMASIKKLPPILLLSEVEMTSALQDDRSPISKRHMVAIQSSGSMVADMITPLTHTIVEHRKMEPLNVDVWKMGRVGAPDHVNCTNGGLMIDKLLCSKA